MKIDTVDMRIEPNKFGPLFSIRIGSARELALHAAVLLDRKCRHFDSLTIADALRAMADKLEEAK
jgi:hypothetical protein